MLLPGKMSKTLSADRLVQRKVAAKCHHLNAKLKSLLHLPLLICNACFKGAHVQSESCNCYLIADRYKGTVSLNYSHLCSLTLESIEKDPVFEFLCHSHTSPQPSVSLLAFTQPSEPM